MEQEPTALKLKKMIPARCKQAKQTHHEERGQFKLTIKLKEVYEKEKGQSEPCR